jgi:hypothetical protein
MVLESSSVAFIGEHWAKTCLLRRESNKCSVRGNFTQLRAKTSKRVCSFSRLEEQMNTATSYNKITAVN